MDLNPLSNVGFSQDFQFKSLDSLAKQRGQASDGSFQLQGRISNDPPSFMERVAQAGPTDAVGNVVGGFGQALTGELNRLNDLQMTAEQGIQTYASGGNIELHQVMLQVNEAELSLQLASQMRNKMVTAYQQISQMQV